MKFKGFILLIFMLFVLACERYDDSGVEMLDCDSWDVGFGLASGSCVVYEDTLYVLFGREEGQSAKLPSKKMRFAWLGNLGSFEEVELPIDARVNGAAVVVGDKMYAGLGFCGGAYGENSVLCDWWSYDFVTRECKRLSDLPKQESIASIVWSDGDYIYSALGFGNNFGRAVYRYSIVDDKWELYSTISDMLVRADAVGCRVGDYVYMGAGYGIEMRDDWWKYDWHKDVCLRCKKMPGAGRVFSSAVPIGNNVYVLGGRYFGGTETREHFYETVVVYDADADEWRTVGRMEQAAENMIAWEYEGDLYWGLGQCQDGSFVRKIYRRDMK